jgi:ABC-type branched-subunit amino acid transport system permease subunit
MNKSGASVGYAWIFSLVSLFGLGVMFIVFDQVFVAHLIPVMKNMINGTGGATVVPIDNATITQIYTAYDKYMVYWHALPFILFFVIVVYMITVSIRREKDEIEY